MSYKRILRVQGPGMNARQMIFTIPFLEKGTQLSDVVFIKFHKRIISSNITDIQESIFIHQNYANTCILNKSTPKKNVMKKICLVK